MYLLWQKVLLVVYYRPAHAEFCTTGLFTSLFATSRSTTNSMYSFVETAFVHRFCSTNGGNKEIRLSRLMVRCKNKKSPLRTRTVRSWNVVYSRTTSNESIASIVFAEATRRLAPLESRRTFSPATNQGIYGFVKWITPVSWYWVRDSFVAWTIERSRLNAFRCN